MPDGSWLSMFIDRNSDNGYDDSLDGWLGARQDGNIITVYWEAGSGNAEVVTERYKVTRIDG